MKFVALLSGGKDSCFNIIKCIQKGHDLIAVANLMPPDDEIEEMNSFMYQSAAHQTIPLMAECLGVPLFRQPMNRKSLVQTLDYSKDDEDEVEDLFLLLERVLQSYPDLKGVSCGAIISNYQRLRIEDVCNRLNLIPLTYLWQRDRKILLDEMISSGIEAVLVKVAGAGLDPLKHLGMDLQTLRPTLHRLNERFGLDFCGEGGEYESLVLNCSAFKMRIALLETEVLLDEEDSSVANLKIVRFSAVEKVPSSSSSCASTTRELADSCEGTLGSGEDLDSSLREVIADASLKCNYHNCRQKLLVTFAAEKQCSFDSTSSAGNRCESALRPQSICGKDGIGQTSLKVSLAASGGESCLSREGREGVAVRQMKEIMEQLQEVIEAAGGAGNNIRDACFVHLYISDIALFQCVNTEYCKWFDRNPPSRSCVAVSLLFSPLHCSLPCSSDMTDCFYSRFILHYCTLSCLSFSVVNKETMVTKLL
jgi:diphthine-ammonia ligase